MVVRLFANNHEVVDQDWVGGTGVVGVLLLMFPIPHLIKHASSLHFTLTSVPLSIIRLKSLQRTEIAS